MIIILSRRNLYRYLALLVNDAFLITRPSTRPSTPILADAIIVNAPPTLRIRTVHTRQPRLARLRVHMATRSCIALPLGPHLDARPRGATRRLRPSATAQRGAQQLRQDLDENGLNTRSSRAYQRDPDLAVCPNRDVVRVP